MKAAKRVLIVCLLLLAVPLLPLGCDKGESDSAKIEDTVEEGIAAYNARDFEKCLTYVADLSEEKKATLTDLLPNLRDNMTGHVTLVKMENIEVGGSSATADVTGTAQGQTLTVTVGFKKEDGIWRVITEGIL
jgi:hypothetical protein